MMRSIDLFRSSSSSPVESEELPKRNEQPKCILSVLGSSQNQSTVEQSLESIGLELVFVTSGEAADEFLNKRSAVIVITEIDLPMMNGLSLARRIKEDASLGDVPVLLISDSSEGPDKVMGMETGADDYITMPINPSDLRSRVMSLLARVKNDSDGQDSSNSKENDTQEDIVEEPVIGAGAQSIPVNELGLGDEVESPAATSGQPQEAVAAQPDSVIMEELNPVEDLSTIETESTFEEEVPAMESTQPEQTQSAIVEEVDPFSVQETPKSDINVFESIDEKADPPIVEESHEVAAAEAEDIAEPVTPQTDPIVESENVSEQPIIESEVAVPEPVSVNDPGTESMIDDIFGSNAQSFGAQENKEEDAPVLEESVPQPASPEVISVVENAYVPPPAAAPAPVQPAVPVETAPPPIVQPTQPIVQQPVIPQQPIQPSIPAQPVENTTIITADPTPVQVQPDVPPPVPVQESTPIVPTIPPAPEAPQIDMNEMALSDYDYSAAVDDKEIYETTIADLKEFEKGVLGGGHVAYDKLIAASKKIVSSVLKSNYLHIKAIGKREAHDFPVHSINVAIFSVKLATGLKYENKLLADLAVAALLHDVGMLLLPENLRKVKSKISDEEFTTLKTHPNIGSEYIAKALQTNPELAQFGFLPTVVLQEHERFDGTGYPNGAAGDAIHDYAKIIAIIDMYEAVSHPSTYRDEYLAYEALQKVVALKDTYFDVKFLRALVREISVFPIDSLVRLNNGEIGRVIALDGSHPMRPKLKIIYNAEGEKYPEEKDIELAKAPFLYIETPITEDEIHDKPTN